MEMPKHPGLDSIGEAEVSQVSQFTKHGIIPILSDPIPITDISPNTGYLIVDPKQRILSQANNWALFEAYSPGMRSVSFDVDPTTNAATVTSGTLSLRVYTSSDNWTYLLWEDKGSSNYTVAKLTATGSDSAGYGFSYQNGTTAMFMSSYTESNVWWAIVGKFPTWPCVLYSIHKFYLDWTSIMSLLRAEWPSASITIGTLRVLDLTLEMIDDTTATAIYTMSNLSDFQYKAEVFDCDDFSSVYKATASQHAYNNGATRPYAIGTIVADATGQPVHAANIYIDFNGVVKIIDPTPPQSGKICKGKDWKTATGVNYVPRWISF